MALDKVMVLLPALVTANAPLTTPLNVAVPVPPMVLLLPKIILLLATTEEPLTVNAPLETPVPLIVMFLVFANVALLKLKSNVAPAVTLVLVVAPKPAVEPMLNVPTDTEVVPE